jgi:hypothetical protein
MCWRERMVGCSTSSGSRIVASCASMSSSSGGGFVNRPFASLAGFFPFTWSVRLTAIFFTAVRTARARAAHLTLTRLINREGVRQVPTAARLAVRRPLLPAFPVLRREGEAPLLMTVPTLVRLNINQSDEHAGQKPADEPTSHGWAVCGCHLVIRHRVLQSSAEAFFSTALGSLRQVSIIVSPTAASDHWIRRR